MKRGSSFEPSTSQQNFGFRALAVEIEWFAGPQDMGNVSG